MQASHKRGQYPIEQPPVSMVFNRGAPCWVLSESVLEVLNMRPQTGGRKSRGHESPEKKNQSRKMDADRRLRKQAVIANPESWQDNHGWII